MQTAISFIGRKSLHQTFAATVVKSETPVISSSQPSLSLETNDSLKLSPLPPKSTEPIASSPQLRPVKVSTYTAPAGTNGPLLMDNTNIGFGLDLPAKSTRESADDTFHRLGNVDPFVAKLTADVTASVPKLKEGVKTLAGSHTREIYAMGFREPGDELKSSVCGMASRVLGYQLRQKGYQVEQVESQNLEDKHLRSTDHTYLRVKDPAGQEIYVDPTYFQFANMFNLGREDMPKTEVLVARKEQIGEAAEAMAKIREKRLDQVPDRNEFLSIVSRRTDYFSLSEKELAKRFESVWTDKSYRSKPADSKLEHDIVSHRNDPSSVSEPTARLIESGLLT